MSDTAPIEHPTWLTSGDFTQADEPLRLWQAWFDEAVKGIPFPSQYLPAVSKLLTDDGQLEQTLKQASAAASLSAASDLFIQLARLYTTTAQDADTLRVALKLPKGSPQPAATPAS